MKEKKIVIFVSLKLFVLYYSNKAFVIKDLYIIKVRFY